MKYLILLLLLLLVSPASAVFNLPASKMNGNLDINNYTILNWLAPYVSNSTMDRNLSNFTNTPGFVTNSTMQSDPLKLNITGGTMTGILNLTSSKSFNSNIFQTFNNGTLRSSINAGGFQYWYLNSSEIYRGLIAYVTSYDNPGIAFLNESNLNRTDIRNTNLGFEIALDVSSSYTAYDFLFARGGELTVAKLTGSGNAIAQVDSTGKLYVNRTANAGITLKSQDGASWCHTVSNAGTAVYTAGACP